MKLSHFFIEHPRFAAVINIFIMVFGFAAAAFLPVAQYPNIVPPTVQITTAYPGASADTVARTVATPRAGHQWRREDGLHQQPVYG
jgi:multidrug efflux pump subunit AcrB